MHEYILHSYQLPLVGEVGFMRDELGILKHPDRKIEKINVFCYVKKGTLHVIEDGQEYYLKEGSYLFLRKNVEHWGGEFYTPGSEWYYIHFYDPPSEVGTDPIDDFSFFQQTTMILESTYQTKLTLPKTEQVTQPTFIESLLNKLLALYNSSITVRPLQLSMMAYDLFVELYRYKQTKREKSQRIVYQLIDLLNQSALPKLDSQQISEQMGMNYAYLSNLFREQTGKSIVQFQNERLADKAIQMFNSTRLNVSEVSNALGFSNPFYFSRVFKKVMGIPPSTYINYIYRQ